jgi:DnaK suppressor protein
LLRQRNSYPVFCRLDLGKVALAQERQDQLSDNCSHKKADASSNIMMTTDEIRAIRERLLSLQAELQNVDKTSQAAGETVELDQSRVGRLSRMDALQAQQMAQETARRRQQQLSRIEGALRRIESGDYGYCFICKKAIDARRLNADPTITRCIDCAEV